MAQNKSASANCVVNLRRKVQSESGAKKRKRMVIGAVTRLLSARR